MKDASSFPFGLMVAYLLPGFFGLAGMAPLFPVVSQWLRPVDQGQAGLGPAVYTLLAAMTVGMIVSCVRWLILDHLHHLTGVTSPIWDDRALDKNLAAFNYIVEAHYRYYQFYGNMLVALLLRYGINRVRGTLSLLGIGTDIGALLLCMVLFVGSRDALTKYYTRTGRLMGQFSKKGMTGAAMTNGNHQSQEAGAAPRPASEAKPQGKPKAAPAPKSVPVPSEKLEK